LIQTAIDILMHIFVFEIGQEAERSEAERDNWRHDTLEEPGSVQHSPITTKLSSA
jgi:hypothetical protein